MIVEKPEVWLPPEVTEFNVRVCAQFEPGAKPTPEDIQEYLRELLSMEHRDVWYSTKLLEVKQT
jgi:hypothetical protein